MKTEKGPRDVELRLISELMKNCRRSDRELAKAIGTSQPTVSRMINRLEKEGIIKEYAMIPDFDKLGFKIMSYTFARVKEPIPEKDIQKTRGKVRERLKEQPLASILGLTGIGLGADRAIVTYHRTYSDYYAFINEIRQHPLVKVDEVKSFVVDMASKSHFRTLSLSAVAEYIVKERKKP